MAGRSGRRVPRSTRRRETTLEPRRAARPSMAARDTAGSAARIAAAVSEGVVPVSVRAARPARRAASGFGWARARREQLAALPDTQPRVVVDADECRLTAESRAARRRAPPGEHTAA